MGKKPVEIKILQDSRNPTVREIIDAFEGAFDGSNDQPTTVTFYTDDTARDDGLLHLQVTALEYESGQRGMFIIRGERRDGVNKLGKLKGFYNANTKVGHLQPVD